MSSIVIRSAAEEDLPVLAELKATYMRTCYDGFARADMLSCICGDTYRDEFANWLSSTDHRVEVLTRDGVIESYIVYGREADGLGWILESRSSNLSDTDALRMLMDRVADHLREMGCTDVHTWLLRSNYRKRFLFEGYGFRSSGERRKDEFIGASCEMVRYHCNL